MVVISGEKRLLIFKLIVDFQKLSSLIEIITVFSIFMKKIKGSVYLPTHQHQYRIQNNKFEQ